MPIIPTDPALSIALLGTFPPPYGGVQTHVARVHARLRALGIASTVYCPYSEALVNEPGLRLIKRPWWGKWKLGFWGYYWFTAYGIKMKETILHCHEPWRAAVSVMPLVWRGQKTIITIHDQEFANRWTQLNPWDRVASNFLLHCPKVYWVGVSRVVCDQLVKLGVDPARMVESPAYIPLGADISSKAKIPETLRCFLESRSPVLSTYGWMLIRDSLGEDLHSFDHCIELVKNLRSLYPKLGLVILVGNVTNRKLLDDLKSLIQKSGVEKNVFICEEPLADAGRLWSASAAYLRATTTDGDAVSVREALSLRVPVVASNASLRPAGTIVFPKRDMAAFQRAVAQVLADPPAARRALLQTVITDNFETLLALYRRVAQSE